MTTDELRAKAWTFQGLTPPNGAAKVAEEQRNGQLYEYYADSDGNIYYETTRGRKWKIGHLELAERKGTKQQAKNSICNKIKEPAFNGCRQCYANEISHTKH